MDAMNLPLKIMSDLGDKSKKDKRSENYNQQNKSNQGRTKLRRKEKFEEDNNNFTGVI